MTRHLKYLFQSCSIILTLFSVSCVPVPQKERKAQYTKLLYPILDTLVVNISPMEDSSGNTTLNGALNNLSNTPTKSQAVIDQIHSNLRHALVTPPQFGTTTCSKNNCTYTPRNHYCGDDQFQYKIYNGNLPSKETATVKMNVKPSPDIPVIDGIYNYTRTPNKPGVSNWQFPIRGFDIDHPAFDGRNCAPHNTQFGPLKFSIVSVKKNGIATNTNIDGLNIRFEGAIADSGGYYTQNLTINSPAKISGEFPKGDYTIRMKVYENSNPTSASEKDFNLTITDAAEIGVLERDTANIINYGSAYYHLKTAKKNIKLKNTGNHPIRIITTGNLDYFYLDKTLLDNPARPAGYCSRNIPAGVTCGVDIYIYPTDPEAFTNRDMSFDILYESKPGTNAILSIPGHIDFLSFLNKITIEGEDNDATGPFYYFSSRAEDNNSRKTIKLINLSDRFQASNISLSNVQYFPKVSGSCSTLAPLSSCELVYDFDFNAVSLFEGIVVKGIKASYKINNTNLEANAQMKGEIFPAGNLLVTPSSINFGKILYTSSKDQVVILKNNPNSQFNITNINLENNDPQHYSVINSTCNIGISLAPNSTCQFTVRFTPNAGGIFNSFLNIKYNDGVTAGKQTKKINFSGTGADHPNLAFFDSNNLEITDYVFGSVSIKDAKTKQFTIKVKNKDFPALDLDEFNETPLVTPFSISSSNCNTTSLNNSNRTCNFSLRFNPQRQNDPNLYPANDLFSSLYTGSFSDTHNTAITNLSLTLNGIQDRTGKLVFSGTSKAFKSKPAGCGPQSISGILLKHYGHDDVTLINTNNTNFPVYYDYAGANRSFPGENASSPACVANQSFHNNCNIKLEFLPNAIGMAIYSFALEYRKQDNSTTMMEPIQLQGMGTTPKADLKFTTTPGNFGTIKQTNITRKNVEIKNEGCEDATINTTTLPQYFTIVDQANSCVNTSQTINGDATCSFQIEYAPGESSSGNFVIDYKNGSDNGLGTFNPNATLTTTVEGHKLVASNLQAQVSNSPVTELDFGMVEINKVGTKTLTLKNLNLHSNAENITISTPTSNPLFAITKTSCPTLDNTNTIKTCSLQVKFNPTQAIVYPEDSITITWRDGITNVDKTQSLVLKGTGKPPAALLIYTHPSLNFGTLKFDIAALPATSKTITIKNNGGENFSPIFIDTTDIDNKGHFTINTNTCGDSIENAVTLSPTQECTINIVLDNKAVKPGDFSSSLNVKKSTGTNLKSLPISISYHTNKLLAVGGNHTCARKNNAQLACWGANAFGQLGIGNTTQNSTPQSISLPGLANDEFVEQISSGRNHTCAKTNKAKVFCWGDNQFGQMGISTSTARLSSPTQVPLTVTAKSVIASGNKTCIIHGANDEALCYGTNDKNLGSDFDFIGFSLGSLSKVKTIHSGVKHVCVLQTNPSGNNKVHCWGDNEFGALARLNDGANNYFEDPHQVNSNITGNVVSLTTGFNHTCSLDSSGKVKCWGLSNLLLPNNSTECTGALGACYESPGYGYTAADISELSTTASHLNLGTNYNVSQLVSGDFFNCVVGSNGTETIKCWGKNTKGQLLKGNTNTLGDIPTEMGNGLAAISLGSHSINQIQAGAEHVCVLTEDQATLSNQKILCWGSNEFGQITGNINTHMGDNGSEKDSLTQAKEVSLN